MRFSTILPAICALLALCSQSVAGTEWEEDSLIINPISDTRFEVVETQDMSPRAFWCGAATFIERRSGRSGTTEIFLLSPRGPSLTARGRKGVIFTTEAADVIPSPPQVSVNVTQAGQMLRSYQARGFCRDAFTRATK